MNQNEIFDGKYGDVVVELEETDLFTTTRKAIKMLTQYSITAPTSRQTFTDGNRAEASPEEIKITDDPMDVEVDYNNCDQSLFSILSQGI